MGCGVDGSDREVWAKGWCNMHYHRIRRLGDPGPVGPLTVRDLPPVDRFWLAFEQADDSGCWLWRNPARDGYGQLKVSGVHVRAHRFAYELLVGPIPEGLVIDHLCREPRCVNPGHMEPVTDAENLLRGEGICAQNARKTHCHRGHPLSGPDADLKESKQGYRVCKRCQAINQRNRRARLKQQAMA